MAEPRFLDFLDRIDGGGMGQSGDTFEGGGLLSMLGNLFASPYGSEDPERRARRDAFYAGSPMVATGFNPTPARTAAEMSTGGDPRPAVLRQGMQPSAFEALSPVRDPYDMQQRADYAPTTGTQADLFLASLRAQHGPEKAYAIAKSPFARDLFSYYVSNNYTLPAM
jgi:hypothetical protein